MSEREGLAAEPFGYLALYCGAELFMRSKDAANFYADLCEVVPLYAAPAKSAWQPDPRTIEECAKIAERVAGMNAASEPYTSYIQGRAEGAQAVAAHIRTLVPSSDRGGVGVHRSTESEDAPIGHHKAEEDAPAFERATEIVARQLASFRLGDCENPFAYSKHEQLCAGHIVGALWGQDLLNTGNEKWIPVETEASALPDDRLVQPQSDTASECKADFYALWCDDCNAHPSKCKRRGSAVSNRAAGPQADPRDTTDSAQSLELADAAYERLLNSCITRDNPPCWEDILTLLRVCKEWRMNELRASVQQAMVHRATELSDAPIGQHELKDAAP